MLHCLILPQKKKVHFKIPWKMLVSHFPFVQLPSSAFNSSILASHFRCIAAWWQKIINHQKEGVCPIDINIFTSSGINMFFSLAWSSTLELLWLLIFSIQGRSQMVFCPLCGTSYSYKRNMSDISVEKVVLSFSAIPTETYFSRFGRTRSIRESPSINY